jgi:hypothetical protein
VEKSDLRSVVRRVLREQDETGSVPDSGVIFVSAILLYQLLNLVFVSIVALIGELIRAASKGKRLMREELLYAQQRDGTLRITVANKSSQQVRAVEAYGGFLLSPFGKSPEDQMGSVQKSFETPRTLGFYLGGGKKVNVESLLTGRPHPEAIAVPLSGEVQPDEKEQVSGSLTDATYGLDQDLYQAPFVVTHVKLLVGEKQVVVPVAATKDGSQVTAVSDAMIKRRGDRPA